MPIKLTPSFVHTKTEEFKKTRKCVWNIDWLKDALKELSNGKCAYCECSLLKESDYMEVEHFQDKDDYPEKVMVWDNLLPSCKHCNGCKSNHDVIAEPIVNPFVDNPNNHLYFQLYRYKAKDDKGDRTISVLGLNDGERRMVDTRFEIGNQLQDDLSEQLDKLANYVKSPCVIRKNKLLGSVNGIMRQCLPESEYAALCATVLHSCNEYHQLKQGMIENGLWTPKLEEYDRLSLSICLFR